MAERKPASNVKDEQHTDCAPQKRDEYPVPLLASQGFDGTRQFADR
jgi:hypothetical protein